MATLDSKLVGVVGDRTTKVLRELFGYTTISDLLHHYPRRYLVRGELSNISELIEGDEVTILAEIYSATSRRLHARKGNILEVVVTDGTAKLSLTFFNQAWREKELKVGKQGLFAGKVGVFNGKRQLAHPDYELIADGSDVDSAVEGFAGKYLPMYPASSKLPSWKISQCIELAIGALDEVPDFMPDWVRDKYGYPTLHQALVQLHNPIDLESAEKSRQRITFDEALLLQLLLLTRRRELKGLDAVARPVKDGGLLTAFDASLPFELTAGQKAVAAEISDDLAQPHPMHRLLQGEVGSGKTVVALRAALTVIDNGGQAALLAPTEVLAAQHLRTIEKLLGALSQGGMLGADEKATQVTLITGSQSAAARREALAKAASGDAGIVIGTHALLGESVEFKDLGLIIVDEQHRFGVRQRLEISQRIGSVTYYCHQLMMSATPIPRTLAMTYYADLDVSVIDELPPGRQPITTKLVKDGRRQELIAGLEQWLQKGLQAYWVCPLIEESEVLQLQTAVDSHAELSSVLSHYQIGLIHGRQKAEEKAAIMADFKSGKTKILVSTTVIEVGVDVPNAALMVIEHAERFGYAQIHQLRGRVGRGSAESSCILMYSEPLSLAAKERLQTLREVSDGFVIAERDLALRGPGELLGAKQSGDAMLRFVDLQRDAWLIQIAQCLADRLLKQHPDLVKALLGRWIGARTEFLKA